MAHIDPLFGIHAGALALQRQRMEVLSANLANADTPHYQARDIDFARVLASAQNDGPGNTPGNVLGNESSAAQDIAASGGTLLTTNAMHIGGSAPQTMPDPGLVYRVPLQSSVDGNTVDEQVEQAKFADAALHYEASLTFMSGEVKNLMTAITGS